MSVRKDNLECYKSLTIFKTCAWPVYDPYCLWSQQIKGLDYHINLQILNVYIFILSWHWSLFILSITLWISETITTLIKHLEQIKSGTYYMYPQTSNKGSLI